jgi:hypothetical protein
MGWKIRHCIVTRWQAGGKRDTFFVNIYCVVFASDAQLDTLLSGVCTSLITSTDGSMPAPSPPSGLKLGPVSENTIEIMSS